MSEDEDSEEIRFAKTQQWRVATAALTLLGAAFAVAHALRPLACWEKAVATGLALLIGGAGISALVQLQNHLAEKRSDHAWRRGGTILFSLVLAVAVGAVVAAYSFWRSP